MSKFEENFNSFILCFKRDFVHLKKNNDFLFEKYIFSDVPYTIVLVPLDFSSKIQHLFQDISDNTTFVYEDLWWSKKNILMERIRLKLGFGEKIFARNTIAREILPERAYEFLDKNHHYGYLKGRYRYGLFEKNTEELIAVAVFSESRPMNRQGNILRSYEWLRAATLPGKRIVGGMGKLMKAFINQENPDEIMSYSDNEISNGNTYSLLGFCESGSKPPISLWVNKDTMERISTKKKDAFMKMGEDNDKSYIEIMNMGSKKFIWTNICSYK